MPLRVSDDSGAAELPAGAMTAWALASRLGASAALAQKTWPGWTAARYPVAVLRDSTATATSGAAIFGAGFGLTGTCPGGPSP